jgi:PhnB protein
LTAEVSKRDHDRAMKTNRSAPHARLAPVLYVSDVRAAVTWYARAFGFVEHVQIGEGHRAQLGIPGAGAELVVAEPRPGRRVPVADRSHQLMLKVEDCAATVQRAVTEGATVDDPVHDWEYGERQAALTDPFGHQWVLNQTLRDTAPEEWGGKTVVPR